MNGYFSTRSQNQFLGDEVGARHQQSMFNQVKELLNNYGQIDIIWFDGSWERTPEQWQAEELAKMIRELQPNILISDRLPKESGKRHPTIGSHVVVGVGAKVLGNIQIGDRVRVGAGSVVLRDVPSDTTVVGIPGRITRQNNVNGDVLAHGKVRDVEAEAIRALFERVKALEKQLEQLHTESSLPPIPEDNEVIVSITWDSDRVIEDFLDGAGI